MKNTTLSILASTLVIAPSAFAWMSPIPVCTKGALNLVIADKNVGDCENIAKKPNTKYCIFDTEFGVSEDGRYNCMDIPGDLRNNATNSISFTKNGIPSHVELTYKVTRRDGDQWPYAPDLKYVYDHGKIATNCAESMGPDVHCDVTESTVDGQKTLTLTISK